MIPYHVLVDFLRAQAKNREEQAALRLKDAHPNGALIGKLRTEARNFSEAARLIEVLPAPIALTSEQSEKAAAAEEAREATPPSPPKRLGRPPKMTPEQIAQASTGPAAASVRGPSDDEAALTALRRA